MQGSIARQILRDVQYATIATIDAQGNPWNTPVFCAYDENNNIYWSSHLQSVHSQNIHNSGKAFIVIYNSKASEGEGVGLYADVSAEIIEDENEIRHALEILGNRRGRPFRHPEKFTGNGQQRIYKAVPKKWWINDAHQDSDGDFIKDFRIEVQELGMSSE